MKKTFLFSIKNIPVLFRITALLLLAIMLAVVFCNIDPESILVDETLYAEEISRAAARHALPQDLVKALIRRESHFNANAVGSHGEIGLMQLMPSGAVAEWARVKKTLIPSDREVFDVKLNLEIGCWYLARCIKKWKSYKYGTELALAQYNAGEKHALRWKPEKKDAPVLPRISWPGTRRYVKYIMNDYHRRVAEHNKNVKKSR